MELQSKGRLLGLPANIRLRLKYNKLFMYNDKLECLLEPVAFTLAGLCKYVWSLPKGAPYGTTL